MPFTKPTGVERRTVSAELRTGAGDEFSLLGYAATFNSWSKDLGGFREIIRPGTFVRSIRAGADVKCLFNHAADNILGRTKSGTLQVEEDSKGLRFRCQLDRTSQAHRDLYSAVKRGDIDECSFAFSVAKGGQSWDEGTNPETGEPIAQRTLTDVDLIDVSCVTYPAYNQTSVEGRTKTPDYAGRKFVPQSATEKLWHARKQMRRAAAMLARPIVEAQKRDEGWDPIVDMASQIRCNLDLAHRSLRLRLPVAKPRAC